MLPTHVDQMGRGPGRSIPIGRLRMRRARSVTRDIWFYAAEAMSESPPSRELLSQIMAADNRRLSKSPGPYARQQRPRSKRLRCMLCLREMREWITWDNSNEQSSWREFNNHLRGVHLITCIPEKPRLSQSYIPPVARKPSVASSYPKSISKAVPSASAMVRSQPPQLRLPTAPSTYLRRDVPLALESRRKDPVAQVSFEDETSETDSELTDTSGESETGTDSELSDRSDSDSETDSEMEDAESGSRVRMGLTTMVKMLGAELDRATAKRKRVAAECKRLTTERDRIAVERDRAAVELDRVVADRDHEAKSRRLLEGEVLRLNEAARAREDELLKQSRLISELLQDLRHALGQGSSSSSA